MQCLCVGFADCACELGGAEEAAIEEVGGLTAGFEGEGAEGEDVGGETVDEEVFFVLGNWSFGGHCCDLDLVVSLLKIYDVQLKKQEKTEAEIDRFEALEYEVKKERKHTIHYIL